MCLQQPDLHLMDSLDRPLDLFNVSESLWNDKCDHLDTETCKNFNPNGMNFIVLQLNVRSLLSHQSDLRNLLHELDRRNSTVDILLLCETFLNKKNRENGKYTWLYFAFQFTFMQQGRWYLYPGTLQHKV